MKPIIIDIEEMSDSTEVYGTQPSRVFSGIIYTLAALFVFAVVWMCCFQMDVVTHANGVVQSSDATATITNVSAGKLEEIRFLDGDYVKKGETLFIVDTEELMQQKEQSKQEIVKLEKEIEILQAYLEALDGQRGCIAEVSG